METSVVLKKLNSWKVFLLKKQKELPYICTWKIVIERMNIDTQNSLCFDLSETQQMVASSAKDFAEQYIRCKGRFGAQSVSTNLWSPEWNGLLDSCVPY